MKVGLVLNKKRELDAAVLEDMLRIFIRSGAGTELFSLPDDPGVEHATPDEGFYKSSDVLVVFGGDGTLLRCARDAARFEKPVLGINIGHLGFLTETDAGDLAQVAKAILGQNYTVEERLMLSCRMPDGSQSDALNDVVVSRKSGLRVLYNEVFISEQLFDRYSSDGVVVASPTGSTAYSLSCGGPVISPQLDCMVLCPICPHSLRGRPVVVSPDEAVRVRLSEQSETARVDADGQPLGLIGSGESVQIGRSVHKARFLRLKERLFYSLLREKLTQWSL